VHRGSSRLLISVGVLFLALIPTFELVAVFPWFGSNTWQSLFLMDYASPRGGTADSRVVMESVGDNSVPGFCKLKK